MDGVELHDVADLDAAAAAVRLGDQDGIADDLERGQHRGAHGRHGAVAELLDEVEDEAGLDHGDGEPERVADIPPPQEVEGSEGHGISGFFASWVEGMAFLSFLFSLFSLSTLWL